MICVLWGGRGGSGYEGVEAMDGVQFWVCCAGAGWRGVDVASSSLHNFLFTHKFLLLTILFHYCW